MQYIRTYTYSHNAYNYVKCIFADPDDRFDKAQETLVINFAYLGGIYVNICTLYFQYHLCCMPMSLLSCTYIVYFLEIFLKLFALGPVHYFRSRWNV